MKDETKSVVEYNIFVSFLFKERYLLVYCFVYTIC